MLAQLVGSGATDEERTIAAEERFCSQARAAPLALGHTCTRPRQAPSSL